VRDRSGGAAPDLSSKTAQLNEKGGTTYGELEATAYPPYYIQRYI